MDCHACKMGLKIPLRIHMASIVDLDRIVHLHHSMFAFEGCPVASNLLTLYNIVY